MMFMKMMVAFMNMMMMVVLIMVMVIVFKILRSQFKNQVRDLESNQTLIAKPFPELVTSRLAMMKVSMMMIMAMMMKNDNIMMMVVKPFHW